MTKNMGTADSVIRILAAIAIAALYLTSSISGVVAIGLAVVAVVFLVTSLVGFCPAYVLLGISMRSQRAGSVHV
ncbi:MAG TPA: DUF2892 domain-containing protein [Vicinamibacterales bacterium]|nr:DUF2892 domain-containing protein [Vicinamibacterales bacterium]